MAPQLFWCLRGGVCQERVSNKSVLQERSVYPTQVSGESVLQECQVSVSYKSVK